MTNEDNTLYHFSDEEDGQDAILAQAFERWEQIGGGAAIDPLFHFKMQPIGRRRCWRNVLERVQFNAQLRQLRDPLAGDNIGFTFTEALHDAIENELQREQRPAYHFVNFSRVHPRLPNGEFQSVGVRCSNDKPKNCIVR